MKDRNRHTGSSGKNADAQKLTDANRNTGGTTGGSGSKQHDDASTRKGEFDKREPDDGLPNQSNR